ncbi:Protein EBS1 [Spathaspora sp. JA1]|nr:Protein EBS1 [Spathaspora sp. JA1]
MAQKADEILAYKNQLNEFLGRKFPDLSLLIGFNTLLQSKFQTWITSDLKEYFSDIENGNDDASFNTMKYLETIWNDFHYPTIKFFQHQHQILFQDVQESFKNCQLEGRANQFKTKPVEMRKVNDNFIKFSKQVFQFYLGLLKYFTTKFSNSFIPCDFLKHFNLIVSENAASCKDNNFQANVLYLIHRCVLSLGDICRHQTFVELSYVQPVSTNREFFKFRSLTTFEKTKIFLPKFSKAIQYYKYCIMLLPALNEPYNHIGMIYNLVEDRFEAIYWFLRSQFTRIPDYKLGLSNLNNVLKKHWFTTALVDIVNKNTERQFKIEDSLNIYLICLMGYFYYPQQYKNGPNLVKKLSFSKIESEFFKCFSNNFSNLIETDKENCILTTQLTVLFSFVELCNSNEDPEVPNKIIRFTFRYIERIFDCLKEFDQFDGNKSANIYIILRFILNWLKENKSMYLTFESRKQSMLGLCNILNKMVITSGNENIKNKILAQSNRPTRKYYFWEDVHFRDFKLIKYQFKDFKDDALFQINNINFLVGDYSQLLSGNIPTFLSPEKQEFLADCNPKEIAREIECYENDLRIHALLTLGKRLLFASSSFEVSLDESSLRFSAKEKAKINQSKINEVKEIKKKEEVKNNGRQETKNSQVEPPQKKISPRKKISRTPTPSVEHKSQTNSEEISGPQVRVPVSLEEIESFISKHTKELKSGIENAQEVDTEEIQQEEPEIKLHNMVDSLVDDDSITISQGSTKLNSSIWKHETVKEENQPRFADNLTHPIQPSFIQYPTTNYSQYFYPQMSVYPPPPGQPQQFPYQSPQQQFPVQFPPVFPPVSQPQQQQQPTAQLQEFPHQPIQPMFGAFTRAPDGQLNNTNNNQNNGNENNDISRYPPYFNS